MAEAIGRCMICGGRCFNVNILCGDCWNEYPELQRPVERWPEWAQELSRLHHQERHRERRSFLREREGWDDESGAPPGLPSQRGWSVVWEQLSEMYGDDYSLLDIAGQQL